MKVGDSHEARFRVQPSDSAHALEMADDSFPDVFATSRMVTFMEIAATRLMRPLLEPGQHSVGVAICVTHTAPTPIGANVRTVATYLGADGKLFRFKVEAFDDAGPIGAGEHSRAVVTTSRLLAAAETVSASAIATVRSRSWCYLDVSH